MNQTETFQHYQVLRKPDGGLHELGRGAMGITYKAFDTNLRCYVALKVINALQLESEQARARFLREARAAAGLRHRNVASVYHLGTDEQSFFYAMEFIDGETVENLVKRRGALPPAEALQIVLQVSRALGAAHKQNLVHRDIKPANLMVVTEDEEDQVVVKVIDFGLARSAVSAEGSGNITMGGFVGTPQYASPEQLQEQDLDTRSDMYSLGITLWYMLVGRPPFTGALGNIFLQHLTKEPPWEQLGAQITQPVRALLGRMLAKNPDLRLQTPLELRRDIEGCLRTLSDADTLTTVLAPAAEAAAPDTSVLSDTPTKPRETNIAATPPPDITAPDLLSLGSLLAGRYRLLKCAGEGNSGRVFQAEDTTSAGRLVAVKVFHPELLITPGEVELIEGELAKIRAAPHVCLLDLSPIDHVGDVRFVASEWANGFTLVDLLRGRGRLTLRETLRVLELAAEATDHALTHRLQGLELGLHQILTHFPEGTSTFDAAEVKDGPAGAHPLLAASIERWPPFLLKINPLTVIHEGGELLTWTGDRTMLPTPRTVHRDTQTSIHGLLEGSYSFALAAMVYELLNGAPPAIRPGSDGGGTRYVVLPALNEDANLVLRRCLSTDPGFSTGREFYEALARASGLGTLQPIAHEHETVAPPAPLPEPPGTRTDTAIPMARSVGDSAAARTSAKSEFIAEALAGGPAVADPVPAPVHEPEDGGTIAAPVSKEDAKETRIAGTAKEDSAVTASSSIETEPDIVSPTVADVQGIGWSVRAGDATVDRGTSIPAAGSTGTVEEPPPIQEAAPEASAASAPAAGSASQTRFPQPIEDSAGSGAADSPIEKPSQSVPVPVSALAPALGLPVDEEAFHAPLVPPVPVLTIPSDGSSAPVEYAAPPAAWTVRPPASPVKRSERPAWLLPVAGSAGLVLIGGVVLAMSLGGKSDSPPAQPAPVAVRTPTVQPAASSPAALSPAPPSPVAVAPTPVVATPILPVVATPASTPAVAAATPLAEVPTPAPVQPSPSDSAPTPVASVTEPTPASTPPEPEPVKASSHRVDRPPASENDDRPTARRESVHPQRTDDERQAANNQKRIDQEREDHQRRLADEREQERAQAEKDKAAEARRAREKEQTHERHVTKVAADSGDTAKPKHTAAAKTASSKTDKPASTPDVRRDSAAVPFMH